MIMITTMDALPECCYECPCSNGESGYCQADKERGYSDYRPYWCPLKDMLKEQEKKKIKLHKKYVITWKRDDEFTIGKLYEAICETLLDEGELFIERTDDREKVDFTFYIAEQCAE